MKFTTNKLATTLPMAMLLLLASLASLAGVAEARVASNSAAHALEFGPQGEASLHYNSSADAFDSSHNVRAPNLDALADRLASLPSSPPLPLLSASPPPFSSVDLFQRGWGADATADTSTIAGLTTAVDLQWAGGVLAPNGKILTTLPLC